MVGRAIAGHRGDAQAGAIRGVELRALRELAGDGLDGDSELLHRARRIGRIVRWTRARRGLVTGVVAGDRRHILNLGELDLEALLVAEAHDVDVDDVARFVSANDALKRVDLVDRLAVGLDDDVADLEAGFLGRAADRVFAVPDDLRAGGAGETGPLGRGRIDFIEIHADDRALHRAILDQIVHDLLGEADRNREAVPVVVA